MSKLRLLALIALSWIVNATAEESAPLLLRNPTLNRTHIVFSYAGDLWSVPRQGGDAQRLTAGVGAEARPMFSPDGQQIAFTGEYDGNVDVYVVPAGGGVPQRLTWHPETEEAVGWTPDGRSILFRSPQASFSGFDKLFTVPVAGGFPTELPLPMGQEGAFSPDGKRLAYVKSLPGQKAWKRYRGGQTSAIWIAQLPGLDIEVIPRQTGSDWNPLWLGSTVYFLSDRDGAVRLYAYDTVSRQVKAAVTGEGLDLKSASAGPDAIVYEQFGSLHLFDPATGIASKVEVRVTGDLPEVRKRFLKLGPDRIVAASLSPTGVRAVFEAHGEIFTVPAEKGDIRNLTNTPGAAERDPTWSPDGKRIAYFSDESGEYALHIRGQSGFEAAQRIVLGQPPSFYYRPVWSPDSQKIAYTDKRLNVWVVELENPQPVLVDTDLYEDPFHYLNPVWSPDSRWLAYTRQLPSHVHTVFIYSLEEKKTRPLTDGMSDSLFAAFDASGKYLYFTASTNFGLNSGWIDMSSMDRPLSRNVYVAVLRKDLPSPLAPQTDEEKDSDEEQASSDEEDPTDEQASSEEAEDPDEDSEASDDPESDGTDKAETAQDSDPDENAPEPVQIDFEGIDQRILALPIPARNYQDLQVGKAGFVFLLEGPSVPSQEEQGPPALTVQRFELETRETEKFLDPVTHLRIAANGEKLLYQQGGQWFIASATEVPSAPGEALKLEELEVQVDPRAEWTQMYHEAWRLQRDFFYDPNYHGLDLKAAEKRYAAYLPGLASRADLNYLFEEMLGELTVGHLYVWGGQHPETTPVPGGLLGADYAVADGRYRFRRIYDGENWNPDLQAPLTQPGVSVEEGEYLLGVNGRELKAEDNLYSFFEGTAGRSTVLKVGKNPDGTEAREVTVIPIESETGLRNLAWIEGNRRKVEQLSGGRLAYVYLPDTGSGGYTNFNRYYFAQLDKQGVILDERFNGGGYVPDYIVDLLRRPVLSIMTTREGRDFADPVGSIPGPKAMIIDEFAGSGGDALPWYFRKLKLGTLVGKRTWGGLVGIYDYPQLLDGGVVTAPRIGFYGLEGQWEVENQGIAPDIEVEMTPKLVAAGHDPQLEKAVEVLLADLEKTPAPKYSKPAYPNYHQQKSGQTPTQPKDPNQPAAVPTQPKDANQPAAMPTQPGSPASQPAGTQPKDGNQPAAAPTQSTSQPAGTQPKDGNQPASQDPNQPESQDPNQP